MWSESLPEHANSDNQADSAAGSDLSPAGLRGIVHGLVAAGSSDPRRALEQGLLADLDCDADTGGALRGLCDRLVAESREAFAAEQFDFGLGLAAADTPDAWAADLRDWSSGFLFGFGLGSGAAEGIAEEALADLVEISRLDLASITEIDDSEEALMLVEEHLRTAAQLLSLDAKLGKRPGGKNRGYH
jgi:uncharacterized protein YgfB (UPF0149 family)